MLLLIWCMCKADSQLYWRCSSIMLSLKLQGRVAAVLVIRNRSNYNVSIVLIVICLRNNECIAVIYVYVSPTIYEWIRDQRMHHKFAETDGSQCNTRIFLRPLCLEAAN